MSRLTLGSLFTGIGGFDLAAERAGFEVKWQVEIDKDANTICARHWPDMMRLSDIREAGVRNLERVNIICGGWPCQDLSVAGKREGLGGARSGLFWEAVRVIRELEPSVVLLENVPGLISSHDGRDFASVLLAFRELGARDIAWRVLDAQHFGVPQRRRRIFLVADFRGERAAEVLFESESVSGHPPSRREAGQGIAASLTAGSTTGRGVNRPGRRGEDDINLVTGPITGGGHRGYRVGAEEAAGGQQVAHQPVIDLADTLTVGANQTMGFTGWDSPASESHAHVPDGTVGAIRTQARMDHAGDESKLLVARCQTASNQRIDADTENLLCVTGDVSHALSAEGADASEDGTGRGTPIIPILEAGARQGRRPGLRDGTGIGNPGDPMFSLQASKQHGIFIPFDTTQVTSDKNYSQPREGDTDHPLAAGAHAPAIAFAWQQGDDSKHGKGGRGRSWVARAGDYAAGLSGSRQDAVAGQFGVRRLTPLECSRLQGLPDGWVDGVSDSAAYRLLGNSVAVPCVEWILRRVAAVMP